MSDSHQSINASIHTLADVATMYILDCQLEDVVPPDDRFREYIQTCDNYWQCFDAFSVALLDAEAQVERLIDDSYCNQVMESVPEHHQYVADDFVSRFNSCLESFTAEHQSWDAFALYAACMTRFIDRFLTHTQRNAIPFSETLETTGGQFCKIIHSVVSAYGHPHNQESVDSALASLDPDQLWDNYVLAGIRRFQTESKNAIQQSVGPKLR